MEYELDEVTRSKSHVAIVRFRFSLRALLLLLPVATCAASVWLRSAWRQEALVRELVSEGAHVYYRQDPIPHTLRWHDEMGEKISRRFGILSLFPKDIVSHPLAVVADDLPASRITQIRHLRNVRYLSLQRVNCKEVDWASHLPRLRVLVLNDSSVTKVPSLPSVTHLSLRGTAVSDLEPLTNYRSLKCLDISHTQVSSLGEIGGHHQLISVIARFTPLEDISPLGSCLGLREVALTGTKVRDIVPVTSIPALEKLDIMYTPTENQAGLSLAKGLVELAVDDSALGLDAICSMQRLRQLDLNYDFNIETGISDEAIERHRTIRASLPRCMVFSD